jgi:hypothetical protein
MLKILVVDGFRTGITFPIRLRLYLSTALTRRGLASPTVERVNDV